MGLRVFEQKAAKSEQSSSCIVSFASFARFCSIFLISGSLPVLRRRRCSFGDLPAEGNGMVGEDGGDQIRVCFGVDEMERGTFLRIGNSGALGKIDALVLQEAD